MGWIGITGKVLVFTGRLAQAEGFKEWLESVGSEKVQKWAEERGIKHFKNGRARRVWWNELTQAASSGPLRTLLDNEARFYQELPGHLAQRSYYFMYEGVSLTVSMVPRFLVNIHAATGLASRVSHSDELQRMQGGEPFVKFFLDNFIAELDKALIGASPSLSDPLPTGSDRLLVGVETQYAWPENEPGFYYLAEKRNSQQFDRKERKTVRTHLDKLSARLGALSKDEKEALVTKLLSS